MKPDQEHEFQESLDFLRSRFDELNKDIKRPHSLDAEVLRGKLDQMEALPFSEIRPKRNRTLQAGLSLAACFMIVFGAVYLMRGQSASIEQSPATAMSSTAFAEAESFAEDAPELSAGAAKGRSIEPDTAGVPETAVIPSDEPMAAAYTPEQEESADGMPAPVAHLEDGLQGAPVEDNRVIPSDENTTQNAPLMSESKIVAQDLVQFTSLEEVSKVETLGAYLPPSAPQGMTFAYGAQSGESLMVLFEQESPLRYLKVSISAFSEEQKNFIADPQKPETYDLRMYPLPYETSVPSDLDWIKSRVIFRQEQLSESLLEARFFAREGEVAPPWGQASVLFPKNNMVVFYEAQDVTPKELYQVINTVKEP